MFNILLHICAAVMGITITRLLKEGADRTGKRNGLMLIGALFVLSIINIFLGSGISVATGLLTFVISIVSLVVNIVAIRVFVSDETERLPSELFTRRMGWVVLNAIVGGIVFGIAVGIGFVLLVIPGIFLLVTLAFWTVFVAVEDQNFVEGFQSSWSLTKGHRLRLLGLGIAVMVVAVIVGAVAGIVSVFVPVVGGLIQAVGTAIASVFGMAVLAAAYNRLNELQAADTLDAEGETAPSGGSGEAI